MNIDPLGETILDQLASADELSDALERFAKSCSNVTGIQPDPTFDAWSADSLLEDGVAINPQAAAHCTLDYRRSVVFIRGVYGALQSLRLRFPNKTLNVLYAGCGPFATLIMPLLGKFLPGELNITLLDIHQQSLDSVQLLLSRFGLQKHAIRTIRGDGCHYQHPEELHLVIAETMQKSLEQEPQFAITANLAPQLHPRGVFIPQRIDVLMGMADITHEAELFAQQSSAGAQFGMASSHRWLATLFSLQPEHAARQLKAAQFNEATKAYELELIAVEIPPHDATAGTGPTLFTRITVFEQHRLTDYESQITLPMACHELGPVNARDQFRVSYQLGSYPRFSFERLEHPAPAAP